MSAERQTAASIIGAVHRDELPIMLVIHEDDGDWQFLDGGLVNEENAVAAGPWTSAVRWSMVRRCVSAAIVVLPLAFGATAVLPAAATTNRGVGAHTLIVAVKKNLSPAAEKKLAVLILISQSGIPPAAALATPSKPLTVRQSNIGLYRVKAEIDASCKGTCAASYRISGSANHKLEVVAGCQLRGSGFVCSTLKIVRVY